MPAKDDTPRKHDTIHSKRDNAVQLSKDSKIINFICSVSQLSWDFFTEVLMGSIFGLDSYIDSRIRLQSNWFKSLINVFEKAKN